MTSAPPHGLAKMEFALQSQNTCHVDSCTTQTRNGHKFCSSHEHRFYRYGDPTAGQKFRPSDRNIFQRFFDLVSVTDGCWIWVGAKKNGYGKFSVERKAREAHRVSYELFVGEIPDGLVIDHLCRNTGCVNPSHLEPVANYVNVVSRAFSPASKNLAKTHCKYGHLLSGENVRIRKKYINGQTRICLQCVRRRNDEYRARAREAQR